MSELERLEKRFKELVKKSVKSKEEVDEVYSLGKEIEDLYNKETNILLLELNAKGVLVSSVWDLVNTKRGIQKPLIYYWNIYQKIIMIKIKKVLSGH